MCDRAGAFTLALILLLVGSALPAAADPLAQKALPSLATPPAIAAPAGPETALPVRSVSEIAVPLPMETAGRAEAAAALSTPEALLPRAEPMERGERQRILSYILLQGLQGAGPFAGAR
ncbi:hypothetical protein [Desertibaculum subflavum]|uniref:hypothetical protein n=1 Tax=Desertibaculum subflavum TaxID=2268458 RepID=UPI000E6682FD